MSTRTFHIAATGILVALPLIVAMQTRRAAATAEQLAAARNSGYRTGLAHAALGILNAPPTDGGGTTPVYARGNLHAVHTEYPTPQEKAQ